MFVLEISVTEKCNLGCPYCYVANKPTWMTKEVFDHGIADLPTLMKNAGEDSYYVSFFGGEPLLNWDLIQYAVPKLRSDPKCTGLNIITNLTLIDDEKAKWIKDNGVGVSWSFDGMSSNETRPLLPLFENVNPETNKLFNGIIDLYLSKKDVIKSVTNGCKVMIWPGNVQSMTENFEFFLDWEIYHPDFSLVRDDVWTVDDIKEYRVQLRRLADAYIDKVKSGVFCSVGFFKLAILDSLLGLVKGKRPFGCFAGTHGAVLMSSGEFYPCARFASKKIMLIDDQYNFRYYHDQFNPKNYDKCQTCDIKQVCNAGCSYSQVMNDNKPVDSICELFHINIKESFRIVEELRDCSTFHDIVDMWLSDIRKENKKNDKQCQ